MMSREQAIDFLRSDDLVGIAMEADAIRKKLHPEGIVSYCMDDVPGPQSASCTIVFAPDESSEQFVSRLERLRDVQRDSGALTAVAARVSGTAVEYLRALALSRVYLENIPHVQASWSVGLKLCQIALRFGANDIAGPENEVHQPTEEQLRRLIRDAGFIPKQRDRLFRVYRLD